MPPDTLSLSPEVLALLRGEMKKSRELSAELGGFLMGKEDGGRLVISRATLSDNPDPSPASVLLGSAEMVKAMTAARGGGLRVVGVWHTHIGFGTGPSGQDLSEMEKSRGLVWLICDGGDMRAWRLAEDTDEAQGVGIEAPPAMQSAKPSIWQRLCAMFKSSYRGANESLKYW